MRRPGRRLLVAGLAGLAAALGAALLLPGRLAPSGPPYTPADSMRTMEIEAGFRIELVAAEPDVASPVAMDIDEHGRLFVVEMPGYPLDVSPSGRVRLIEDTTGDGRLDRSTVFAGDLVLPTGIMRWKQGVLVTAAPDLLYLEDSTGDGKADIREIVLTGFAFTNPQHSVNSPVYGLDNWIHLAHSGASRPVIFTDLFGDQGGDIHFPARPAGPRLPMGDRTVSLRPDTFELAMRSGRSQFGHAFDAWGRYLTLDNSNHVRHEVIAARYLARNPDLLPAQAMQDVSDHGSASVIYPISRRPRLELLTEAGQFTSACSLTVYLADTLPFGPEVSSLVAEPVHNLVHRDVWSATGSTFTARREPERREFLAAADPWFRPVNFHLGPDGALYLLDYYREMIEHPEWTASAHHHDSPDLYRGIEHGRIYRIVPDDPAWRPGGRVSLGDAGDEELVAALAHPNIWWRRTAQRLLVDRRSEAAVPALERLAGESEAPLGRLHALWTLEGLGRLSTRLVARALADEAAGVRENAIQLAEPRLAAEPALAPALLALAADPDPRVRFQLLGTLGFVDTPESRAVQGRLLAEHMDDDWVQVAALSVSSDRAPAYFARVLGTTPAPGSPAAARLLGRAASIVGARQREREIQEVVAAAAAGRPADDWWRAAALDGLARGLERRGGRAELLRTSRQALLALFDRSAPPVRRGALALLQIARLEGPASEAALRRAAADAVGNGIDADRRVDAVALLALAPDGSRADLVPIVRGLIDPRHPEALQAAAVRALAALDDDAGPFLLAGWRTMTAPVRSEAAGALVREPRRARLLVDALHEGRVEPWMLGFWQKRALIMHRDPDLRRAAREILEEPDGERERAIARYQAALDRPGDPERGRQVFARACASCHRLDGIGVEVGPDLGTVRNRPASLLLVDILDPSRSIAPRYEAYVVERLSGGIEQGVLGDQTAAAVVLRREAGAEIVIPRDDIRHMYVSTLSAMPADLDRQIDPPEMADLLAYLTGGGR